MNRFFKIFVSAATTFVRAPRAAKVGMFLGVAYTDYPAKSERSRGGVLDRDKA